MTPGRFGDRRRLRIGLLGGSFNPAHAGHLQVAQALRRQLRLDQVWLLVSPGNPLKPATGMASLQARFASAQAIADGHRIIATDLEAQLGTLYSTDTLRALRRRFPRMHFTWLMGADAFADLPRWRNWTSLAPIAVHPRAPYDRAARHGHAAHRLRRTTRFVTLPATPLSATALRAAGLGLDSGVDHPKGPNRS